MVTARQDHSLRFLVIRGCWGLGPLDVLALQEPLQLLELLHCLVFDVGV